MNQTNDATGMSLVIVGGGPNCTYVMDRLAALVTHRPPSSPLTIHVFEKSGHFGAGWVHSPAQPRTSMLNRIVGQVAFAADESNTGAKYLLPRRARPTFWEWCRETFDRTGDPAFDLHPESWPPRYVHGKALVDMFDRFAALLSDTPNVAVRRWTDEVVDVVPRGPRYDVMGASGQAVPADHVLFLTGHPVNRARQDSQEAALETRAARPGFRHVPFAYPLEVRLGEDAAPAGDVVGCIGMGLTAIDVILHLTEGRGGQFRTDGPANALTYIPSGREPRAIVAMSQSGVFTAARPVNAKEVDLARLEHAAVFLTEDAIEQLRRHVGTPAVLEHIGERRQLDFERHLLPIVLLEMMVLYYKTLFGPAFGAQLVETAKPRHEAFLRRSLLVHGARDEAIAWLCEPVEALADEAMLVISRFLAGDDLGALARIRPELDVGSLLRGYVRTLHGDGPAEVFQGLLARGDAVGAVRLLSQWTSPWGHETDPKAHVFDWNRMIAPIDPRSYRDPQGYQRALIAYMTRDHQEAGQGNLANPTKAACDGVWRDLRQKLATAADLGGLTTSSHRIFLKKYMRYHNRVANGTCVEVMEKMLALIRAGLLDVATGPGPRIRIDPATDRVEVTGPKTGHRVAVDTLVDAKLHELDIRVDASPLYRQLMTRGLIRSWKNISADGTEFEPGGIHLDCDFHPLDAGGISNEALTFLGPASEGFMFFQVGAARPNQNHHVLNDVIRWAEHFERVLDRRETRDTADATV